MTVENIFLIFSFLPFFMLSQLFLLTVTACLIAEKNSGKLGEKLT